MAGTVVCSPVCRSTEMTVEPSENRALLPSPDQSVKSRSASELEKANALHAAGKLSDEEFAQLKAKILA